MKAVLEHADEHAVSLLSPEMAEQITRALPLSSRFMEWHLAYRPNTHGVSMQTFYRQLADQGPSLLVIRDSTDTYFGAFASESWAPLGKYFGTGESFVFSFDAEQELTVYPWSSRDEFIQYADEKMFAMGGGRSSAIVVESNFLRGLSQRCSTFLNPSLTPDEDFVIRDLEVWCFRDQ